MWFSLCPISVSVLVRAHDEDLMQFAGFTLLCLLNMSMVKTVNNMHWQYVLGQRYSMADTP